MGGLGAATWAKMIIGFVELDLFVPFISSDGFPEAAPYVLADRISSTTSRRRKRNYSRQVKHAGHTDVFIFYYFVSFSTSSLLIRHILDSPHRGGEDVS